MVKAAMTVWITNNLGKKMKRYRDKEDMTMTSVCKMNNLLIFGKAICQKNQEERKGKEREERERKKWKKRNKQTLLL